VTPHPVDEIEVEAQNWILPSWLSPEVWSKVDDDL
jgi:hypothetical protein